MVQLFGFTPPRLPDAARPLIPRCWRCTTAPAESLSALLNETQPAAFVPPPDESAEFLPDAMPPEDADPLDEKKTLALDLEDEDRLTAYGMEDPGDSESLLPSEPSSWPLVKSEPAAEGAECLPELAAAQLDAGDPFEKTTPVLGIDAVLTSAPHLALPSDAPKTAAGLSQGEGHRTSQALHALSQAIGEDAEALRAAEADLGAWVKPQVACPEASLPSPQDLGAAVAASREVSPPPQGELQFSDECCPVCGEPYLRWPTQNLNYFERLGLKPRYGIDRDELERRYRFLCRELQYAGEQVEGEVDWNALLGEAYDQLQDGEHRAAYLLSLQGRTIQPKPSDAAFLIELCEIGLAMDELGGVDAHVERGRLARDVAGRYEQKLQSMIDLFDGEKPDFEAAAGALREAQALRELLRQIELLDEF